jgi:hypothetical protein
VFAAAGAIEVLKKDLGEMQQVVAEVWTLLGSWYRWEAF